MKGFVVKITRMKWWLDLVAPYTCRGCGALGTVLCECCKNNMFRVRAAVCPSCKMRLAEGEKVCARCELPFERLAVVGWREGLLKRLVEEYKYQGVRELDAVLAELVGTAIGEVGENVVVVPLPTIGRHVRQRGLDHTWRLAQEMARREGWKCQRLLGRAKDTVQVGTKQAAREAQAREAYEVIGRLEAGQVYLLVDDVWTTGASMRAAAEVMRAAGATRLMGAVLATGRPKEGVTLGGEEKVIGAHDNEDLAGVWGARGVHTQIDRRHSVLC